MKRIFAIVLALMMPGLSALAADDVMHPALQKLKDDGGTVDFMGHAYGVDGWRITNKAGEPVYGYTTPEGGLIIGNLFRPDGTRETNEMLKALKGKLDGGQEAMPGAEKSKSLSVLAEKFYAEVEKASWVRAGDTMAPYIYVFMNVACDHCQKLWQDLAAPVAAGRLQVRLIPYGSKDQNRIPGAALLSADDPGAAWNAFIRGDASLLAPDKVKPGAYDRIDANTALYMQWKLQGPPLTVYRRPADGEVTMIVGRPSNAMTVLAELMKKEGAP